MLVSSPSARRCHQPETTSVSSAIVRICGNSRSGGAITRKHFQQDCHLLHQFVVRDDLDVPLAGSEQLKPFPLVRIAAYLIGECAGDEQTWWIEGVETRGRLMSQPVVVLR